MADETFGGVITGSVEPQTIVLVSSRAGPPGPSGYSGYSGSGDGGGGGAGGGSGFSSFSGYSGKSGWSGGSGPSGFSGFSSRSGYSGYSGLGTSGFSGYSGASGTSGAGGGNSGYSGYSGLDGTFSASGYSGFSGFSSRSGFSGYSGSGFSGFSGISGFAQSGFSGFSGFAQSGFSGFSSSGFSGFSSPSGFSGFSARSGFSGFSGTGSPSGGLAGNVQYNDGAGGFGGTNILNYSGGIVRARDSDFFFQDTSDSTKQLAVELGNLPTATTASLIIPAAALSVAVAPSTATTNQFVTGITGLGQITKAQPSFSNISGLVTYGQLDRSTSVVSETLPTLTIAANTKVKSTASGTLTTIAFSGGDNAQQGRRLDLDITGGPYTLNIPLCRRLGETGTITTLQVFAGYNEFSWEYINGEYVLSDSVTGPAAGGGTSGYSGFSGTSGRSGFSGPAGAGTSGFSGFSGFAASSSGFSGFSGFSAPNLLPFSTHNDVDWTLVIGDAGSGVKMASSVAHSVFVPANSVVPFPIGTQIPIEQGGSALVTIAAVPASGVILQGASTTSGLYSVVVLIKQAADTWLVAKSGASGYSGFSGGGGSGYSGYSGGGPSGFSGFSGGGTSGFSGFSGFSGLSGFSGRSGYSGYSAPQLLSFSTQTDTDYTLVLGDANTGVKMASGSPHTLTIPLSSGGSGVNFPIGTQIPIEQGSSGVVTIAPAVGVTLQGGTTTTGQYSMVVLIKQGTDTWLASTGNSGYSGFSGKSGYSGYSAYSGFSAFSGFSGTFGWTKLTVAGSDVTTTGQALTNITGLVTGTLAAATLYEIYAVLKVGTSTGTAGTQYGIALGGSGSAGTVYALITGNTGVTTALTGMLSGPSPTASSSYLTVASINGTIVIKGWVTTTGGAASTISVQHLKVTSGTSTVFIGSYLQYRLA